MALAMGKWGCWLAVAVHVVVGGGPVTSFKSLFGGARGLVTPRCSSDALGRRPGGSLGECFRIRVQEVPQFPDVFRDSAIAM